MFYLALILLIVKANSFASPGLNSMPNPTCSTDIDCQPSGDDRLLTAISYSYYPICVPSGCVDISDYESSFILTSSADPTVYTVQISSDLMIDFEPAQHIFISLTDIPTSSYSYQFTSHTTSGDLTYYIYTVKLGISKTIPQSQISVMYIRDATLEGSDALQTSLLFPGYTVPETPKIEALTNQDSTANTITNSVDIVVKTITITTGVMVVISANPIIVWGILNNLQTLYFLNYIDAGYPPSVQTFSKTFDIGNFNFLPNPFKSVNEDENSLGRILSSSTTGQEGSTLFLDTAGNILFLWLIVLFIYLVAAFMRVYLEEESKVRKLVSDKVLNWFEWSGTFKLLIMTYTLLAKATFLQLNRMSFRSVKLTVSSMLGVAFLVFVFAFPVLIYIIIKRQAKDGIEKLEKNFGVFIENFDKQKSFPKYFMVTFLIRRLLSTAILVFMFSFPYIQSFAMAGLSLLFASMLAFSRPYSSRFHNITNTASEILMLVIYFLISEIVRTDVPSEKSTLGWINIGFCIAILVLTLSSAIYDQSRVIMEFAKKLRKKETKSKRGVNDESQKLSRKLSDLASNSQNILQQKNIRIKETRGMNLGTLNHSQNLGYIDSSMEDVENTSMFGLINQQRVKPIQLETLTAQKNRNDEYGLDKMYLFSRMQRKISKTAREQKRVKINDNIQEEGVIELNESQY